MTRDEQIDLLKGLLARVRAGAIARGVALPKDHARESSAGGAAPPTGVARESSAPLSMEPGEDTGYETLVGTSPVASALRDVHRNGSPGLTAFAESGTGTHAPLALVGAPPTEADAPSASKGAGAAPLAAQPGLVADDDDDDDIPRTAVSISFANDSPHASPQAPPLEPPPVRQPFDAAFEDEITSNGDPEEIEAAVLASADPVPRIPTPPPTPAPITRVPSGIPEAPPTRVLTPVPPAPPTRVVTAAPTAPRLSSLPAVPLTLDDLDLDGLGTPEAAISVPPPRPASYMPPARISHPPAMATPPPARVLTPPPVRVPATSPPYVAVPPPTPAPAYVPTPPPPRVPTPPPYVAPQVPIFEPPPMVAAPLEADEIALDERDLVESAPPPDPDEDVPASQRQMRMDDRPIDDSLEGISEPPPESGEVESQRYTKVADEIEQTTEVRALASVDVVDREPLELDGAAVASFSGKLASSQRPSFGEILDSALDL